DSSVTGVQTCALPILLVEQVRDVPITRYDATGVWHDHIYWFLERFSAAYLAELRAFVACVRDQRPPEVTGEDGWRALLVALAAEIGRASGRERVEVGE